MILFSAIPRLLTILDNNPLNIVSSNSAGYRSEKIEVEIQSPFLLISRINGVIRKNIIKIVIKVKFLNMSLKSMIKKGKANKNKRREK